MSNPAYLTAKSFVAVLVGASFLGSTPTAAPAADIYWTGNATGNWTDVGNWLGGTLPTAVDIATFDQTSFTNNATLNASQYVLGLAIGNTQATPDFNLTLSASQTLYLGSAGITQYANAVGATTISGTGNLVLTAGQTWTNNSANLLSINSAVNTNGYQFAVGGTGVTMIGGILSGAGGLVLQTSAGSGLILSAANTFTGPVFINSGTLSLSGGLNRLPATTWLNLANTAGAVLDLNSNNQQLGTLKGGGSTGGDISLGSGILTVAQSYVTAYGGAIGGTGNVVMNGAGVLALTNNNNSYSGKTSISNGTLVVGSISSVSGGNSALGNAANATVGTIDLGGTTNSGALVYTGTGSTTDRVINLAGTTGGGTLQGDGSGNLVLTSAFTATGGGAKTLILRGDSGSSAINSSVVNDIQGAIVNSSGTTALTKNDPGTWQLSGTNTYTGTTTINNGLLILNNAAALPGGIGSSGGTSGLTFVGQSYLSLMSGVIGLNNSGFARGVGTGASQVQWTGSGGFAALGANRIVNLGGASATMTWASTAGFLTTGNVLILSNPSADATLDFQNPINLNGAARTFQVNNGSAATDAILSGILSGTGASGLTKTGAGTLALTGNNTFAGNTTVANGTLLLDYTTNNTSKLASTNATILAGGTLAMLGSSAANTSQIIGGLTLNPGNSQIVVTSGSGRSATLTLGAIARNAATNIGGTVNFTLPASGNINTTTGNFTASGVNTGILGGYAVVNGADWASATGTTPYVISAYAGYTAVDATNSGSNLNGLVTDNLTRTGPGAFNTLKVTTTAGGQMLTLFGDTTLGSSGLLFTGANDYTITGGALRGSGTNTLAAGVYGELIVHQYATGNLTIDSTLADSLGNYNPTSSNTTTANLTGGSNSLTKSGPGTLILSGTNIYTGTTYLNSGNLTLASARAIPPTSPVVIDNQAGAALNLTANATIGGLSGGGISGGGVNLGTNVLTVNQLLTAGNYTGIINGASGSALVYQGYNNLTLSGGQITGGTAVTMNGYGTVQMSIGSSTNTGYTLHNFSGNFTLNSGLLDVGGVSSTGINPVIDGPVGTGTFIINGGRITDTGAITGGFNLNNPVVIGGNFRTELINNGAINLNGDIDLGSGMRVINSANAANSGYLNLYGKVSGTGGLTFLWNSGVPANSVATLANPESDFSGGVVLNGSTLQIAATGDRGLARGPLGTGTLTINSGTLLALTAAQSVYNPITVNGDFVMGGSQSLTLGGAMNLGNPTTARTIYVGATGQTATLFGSISGSGGLNVIVAPSSTAGSPNFTMAGNNTYTGPTSFTQTAINGDPTITLDYSVNNGSKLDPASPLNLYNRTNLLAFVGNSSFDSSQTINGLNLNAGQHILTFTSQAGRRFDANLGLITRANGATTNINLPTTGNITVANTLSNGILPAWITLGPGATNFATLTGNVLTVPAYDGALPLSGGDATKNYNNTDQLSFTLTGNVAANSFRMLGLSATPPAFNMAGFTLTLTSGGLMVAPNGNSLNITGAGVIDSLTNNELIVSCGQTTVVDATLGGNVSTLTKFGGNALVWTGNLGGLRVLNANGGVTMNATQTMTGNLQLNAYSGGITWTGNTNMGGNNLGVYFNASPSTNSIRLGLLTNTNTLTVQGPNTAYNQAIGTVTVDPGFAGNYTVDNIVWNGKTALTLTSNVTLTGLQSFTIQNPVQSITGTTPDNAYTAANPMGTLTFNATVAMTGNLTFNIQSMPTVTIGTAGVSGNITGAWRIIRTGQGGLLNVPNTANLTGFVNTLGVNGLTFAGTGGINTGGAAFNAETYGVETATVAGNITATDLMVTGSGMHPWGTGQGSVNTGRSLLLLSGNNNFSGNTTITNAYVTANYTALTGRKIGSGVLTLNSAYLRFNGQNTVTTTANVTSTTIGGGYSVVENYRNTNDAIVNLGAITPTMSGTVSTGVLTVRYGNSAAQGTIFAPGTAVDATSKLLGGWATLNDTDFACLAGNNAIVAPGVGGVPGYTTLTAAGTTSPNVALTLSMSNLFSMTMTGATVGAALQMTYTADRGGPNNLNLGTNNLALTTGGIIWNAGNNGLLNINGTGTISGYNTGTSLPDANLPVYLYTSPGNAAAKITINAPLIGSGSGTLVKSGTGAAVVTAAAAYTGGTIINGPGTLQAIGSALSSGQLTLQSGGSLGTNGTFTRSIGTGSGTVAFGTGGGGFSAEGAPLAVNLGGASAPLTAAQLGRYLVLNNQLTSSDVVDFQNPIDITGGMTVAVGSIGNAPNPMKFSNFGAAYSKISGNLSGVGNLLVYGSAATTGGGATGMLVPTGGLNFTGDIIANGAAIYLDNPNAFPGNISLVSGGQLASHGVLTKNLGSGPGQLAFTNLATASWCFGGFAAVGGPLTVNLNGGTGPIAYGVNSNGFVQAALALGNAFSTHAVDFQNAIESAGGLAITSYGYVPNIVSGKLSGTTLGIGTNGAGVLVLTNPNNDFTGLVTINPQSMLRAGSAAALGAPGGGLAGRGSFDLNGFSFDNEVWTALSSIDGGSGNTGPGCQPGLVNFNTTTPSTWGSQSPNANILFSDANTSGASFGGTGTLTIASNFAGVLTNAGAAVSVFLNKKGSGTLILQGDTTGVGFGAYSGGTNRQTGTTLNGGTTKLDFAINTNNKLLFGYTGTAMPAISLLQTTLEMDGNASVATTQNLIQQIGNNVAVNGTTSQYPYLNVNSGFNTIKVVTRGQDTTLEMYNLYRPSTTSAASAVNFSTDSSAGGNAILSLSGAGVPFITSGGTGYTNSSIVPITISPPTSGTTATGYAVSNASGVITAICITNAGSGYTSAPTITFASGTASAILYTNHPVAGILGGYATFNGADWAYRDTATGQVAPFTSYNVKDTVSTWSTNDNITNNTGSAFSGNLTASVTISTLRFNEAVANNTVNINTGQTLNLGVAGNTTMPGMTGGILVTANVGANDVLITGGTVQATNMNDNLAIHQYNTQGNLTIASVVGGNGNRSITKAGPGKLILTGNNTFNSPLYILGGTVEIPFLTMIGNNQPVGISNTGNGGDILVQGGGTLRVTGNLAGPLAVSNKVIQIGTGDGTIEAAGTDTVLTLNGKSFNRANVTYTMAIWDGSATGQSPTYCNLTLSGDGAGIINGALQLYEPYEAEAGSYSGIDPYSFEGQSQLTKSGTGTWTLNGADNFWTGGTIVSGGTLATGYAYHTLPAIGPVTINTNGTLDLLTTSQVTGEVRLKGGTINATGGSGTLYGRAYNFESGTVNVALGGDTATIIKTTGGTVTMTGNNSTFAGGITVNGGSLLINNSAGSGSGTGSILVNSGGTLGGVGIIGPNGTNSVTINAGGILAPGANTGSLVGPLTVDLGATTGGVSLAAGATLLFELGAPGNSDLLQLFNYGTSAGRILALNTNTVNFTTLTGFGAGTYTLFSFYSDNGTTLTDTLKPSAGSLVVGSGINPVTYNAAFDFTPTGQINLVVTLVPEPGTLALLAFGSLAVLKMRRRQSRTTDKA